MTNGLILWAENVRWRLALDVPAPPRFHRNARIDYNIRHGISYSVHSNTLFTPDGLEVKLGMGRWWDGAVVAARKNR